MPNTESLPQIIPPTVPADFNGGVGVDFARALMTLMAQCQISGGNLTITNPFDAAAIQASVEELQDKIEDLPKERVIEMNGVNNGEIPVPFQNIGTTNYSIITEILIPAGSNPPAVGVYIIDTSKEMAQFIARIDGTGNPYKFRFTVRENK